MADYTVSVSDDDMPLLQWALGVARQNNVGGVAELSEQSLVQSAFNDNVIPAWRRARSEATIIDLQKTLNDADEEVKADALETLQALQKMEPAELKAALRVIRGNRANR